MTPNEYRIKKHIGKIIGKIATELYDVVHKEASRLNVYTYEIRTNSKAYKIFLRKEFDFQKENIFWKELLIFLLNNDQEEIIAIMRKMEPLAFDGALMQDYLASMQTDQKKLEHLDEFDSLYEEVSNKRQRLEMLDIIGNPNVFFESDSDDDTF